MLKLYVSLCCNFRFVRVQCSLCLSSQRCASAPVGLRHTNNVVRLRKRWCFGFKHPQRNSAVNCANSFFFFNSAVWHLQMLKRRLELQLITSEPFTASDFVRFVTLVNFPVNDALFICLLSISDYRRGLLGVCGGMCSAECHSRSTTKTTTPMLPRYITTSSNSVSCVRSFEWGTPVHLTVMFTWHSYTVITPL